MWTYNHTDELYHHGILGMKWGRRNGPPYPLSPGDHSQSEKKAGWRKSLDNNEQRSKTKGRGLTEKQKKALKIAGMAALGGLAIYGTYKYSELKSTKRPAIELGMKFVSTFDKKPQEFTVESIKIDPLKRSFEPVDRLESETQKMIDDLMKSVSESIEQQRKRDGVQLRWDLPIQESNDPFKEFLNTTFSEIDSYTQELLKNNNSKLGL